MRATRRTLMVIALVALALVAGCAAPASTPSGGTGGTGGGSSAVSVSMKSFAFSPSDIQVAVGGTVTFTNNDSTAHTVTGASFDSGTIAPGASFSEKFETAGSFPIRCTLHPSMTANVTVK